MKPNIFNIKNFLTFLSLIVIYSCEKVIDIDLNSKSPQIVIEGNIEDNPGSCLVTLSQTVNFNESNNFPEVTGAIVEICDDSGNSEILTETSAGIYTSSDFYGTQGRTYTLSVSFASMNYLATSYMPAPVSIDTLTIITSQTPKEQNRTIYVNFTDPVGVTNYYRFTKIINDIPQTSIYVTDDLLQDGNYISHQLFSKGQNETSIKTGDTVTVLLQSVDKEVYDYFRTLLQLSSGGMINQSTSPANPISNFDNGALGYFNACAVTSKTIIIP